MKILIIYLCISVITLAQTFRIEKVTGEVLVLKGTSENYIPVRAGDELDAKDLIITGENASVQMRKGKETFILNTNSALNLNSIKKLTINELLLALAMEEIRSVPKKNNSGIKSTSVYGSNKNDINVKSVSASVLGMKKLNGAKQLAENGFRESALLAAKEVYRKHPETQKAVNERIYFAGVFEKLKLTDEALNEYSAIYDLSLSYDQKKFVSEKIRGLINK